MRKQITVKWLKSINACKDGIECFAKQKETDPIKLLRYCVEIGRWDWGNWVITRLLPYKQYVAYAVYAAEQVISLCGDGRPREAIAAAKRCIKHPSAANKAAAADAAAAAHAAAADDAGAYAAAYAAAAAAYAAAYADAADAAYAAASAAYAAKEELRAKIINHGIRLLQRA